MSAADAPHRGKLSVYEKIAHQGAQAVTLRRADIRAQQKMPTLVRNINRERRLA
jgi:hypothetical protein